MSVETKKVMIECMNMIRECIIQAKAVRISVFLEEDERNHVFLSFEPEEVCCVDDTFIVEGNWNTFTMSTEDITDAYYDDTTDEYTFIRGRKVYRFAQME